MREIKFRGQSLHTGELAYGVPIFDGDCAYIISRDYEIQVIPETVGQYTGLMEYLRHRDRKEIYGGDRCRVKCGSLEWFGVVKMIDGCWYVETDNSGLIPFPEIISEKMHIEVIGNIHENSEFTSPPPRP